MQTSDWDLSWWRSRLRILNDRAQIAKAVNATIMTLDQAPQGYHDVDGRAAKKFVLDPHGELAA